MLIENAEQLVLSLLLHPIAGRVGRGNRSNVLLFTDEQFQN